MVCDPKFGSGGVVRECWYTVGGYMVLDQFLFLLTVTLCGVGGAFCIIYCGICRFLIVSLIVCICCGVPKFRNFVGL